MALKATIFKAELQMTDLDRHYYQSHTLTIAQHPSETDERMMMRVLAFARHADERLTFGKGIAETDEPDLWCKDLTGAITNWIDVGLPDDRRILKSCGRSEQVIIYAYGSNASIWWEGVRKKIDRARNLTVYQVAPDTSQRLAAFAQRTMQLQCTIEDGELWLSTDTLRVQVDFDALKITEKWS